MTVGQLCNVFGYGNFPTINVQKVIPQTASKQDFTQLEKLLNSMYGGKTTSTNFSMYMDAVQQQVADGIEYIAREFAENLDFNTFVTNVPTADKLSKNFQQTQQSMANTLKKFDAIMTQNNVLEHPSVPISQLQALVNTCTAGIQEARNILSSNKLPANFNYDEFTKAYQVISYVNSLYIHNKGLSLLRGDWFEHFLSSLADDRDRFEEAIGASLIESGFEGLQMGQQTRQYKGVDGIYVAGMRMQKDKSFTSSQVRRIARKMNKTFDGGSLTANANFDPIGSKQGKVDVQINLKFNGNATASTFNISAKNWSKGWQGRDFGTTSIAAAILRVGGNSNLDAYSLGIAHYNAQAAAHNFARACVALDILAGGSLGYNTGLTANALVINLGTQIRVLDMTELLNKILMNPADFITQYNESAIQNAAYSAIRAIYTRHGRTRAYLGTIQSYLAAYRLTIQANAAMFA